MIEEIGKRDVKEAIKKMGKKKAPSVDGLMDVIFEKSTWKKIKIRG